MWYSLHYAGGWSSELAKCLLKPYRNLQNPRPHCPAGLLSIRHSYLSPVVTSAFPSRCREVCIRERQPFSMDFCHLAWQWIKLLISAVCTSDIYSSLSLVGRRNEGKETKWYRLFLPLQDHSFSSTNVILTSQIKSSNAGPSHSRGVLFTGKHQAAFWQWVGPLKEEGHVFTEVCFTYSKICPF